jgi:hypothetical protein
MCQMRFLPLLCAPVVTSLPAQTMPPSTISSSLVTYTRSHGPRCNRWRLLRAIGIPTYGVQGLFMDQNKIRMHGRDERMSVQWFYEG